MIKTLQRMGRNDITVHGSRSSFRDWAEETTDFAGALALAEAALGHVVGDEVEAVYRRGGLFEKRRKLMAACATFCTRGRHQDVPNRTRRPRIIFSHRTTKGAG
jgi:hypothetical protein